MGQHIYRDIEIRGVRYPSASAAGKALGVTADAVRIAVRRGTLHRVGTGRVGAEPLPVCIRGKTFPDARAAAAHFGVCVSAVHSALAAGVPDRVGRKVPPPQPRAKPVTLFGVDFPSHAEASRALGFRDDYLARALKRNTRSGQQRIMAAVMKYVAVRDQAAVRARAKAL